MSPTPPLPAIPWYKSSVTRGALTSFAALLVVLAPKLAVLLGLTSNDAISAVIDNLLIVAAALSALYTFIARIRSPVQPVTLTQAAADTHPATIASALAPHTPLTPVTDHPWEIDLKDKPT